MDKDRKCWNSSHLWQSWPQERGGNDSHLDAGEADSGEERPTRSTSRQVSSRLCFRLKTFNQRHFKAKCLMESQCHSFLVQTVIPPAATPRFSNKPKLRLHTKDVLELSGVLMGALAPHPRGYGCCGGAGRASPVRSATALPPVALFGLVQAAVVAWLTLHLKAPKAPGIGCT